ncbi:zinc-binding dehydrogenase [Gordonia sp. TBRC 11910]|uniref:Zinc-binding dehydrogenase n=1 Tax=Gordonia asplenii TaxID=2725283 RepID=A0A848KS57_9ACTN|nr:zinc-binding dehydrogenase [Gordonia asplenii]NMO01506.1 zinc-binding dehydrogenase [Gordonia asplenii]
MQALIQHGFGDPATVLGVEEVATPEPAPGKVRIRTVLAPIHNHDLWTVRGEYGFKPGLPAGAGTEAVGVVDAVGDGVGTVSVGQRVVTRAAFGTWAEYFTSPAKALIPVPDDIDDETAAQLVAMPYSAVSLLDYLGVGDGDAIVQNTANGAVGTILAQLAPSRGITVVGLVRRQESVDQLAAQGISNIVATDSDGWRAQARELGGERGFRAAIDSIGGEASGDIATLLADDGTLVVFGAMGSPNMILPSGPLIFRQLTVKGFWAKKVGEQMAPEKSAELMGEVFTAAIDGSLKLPVDSVHSFADFAAAAAASARPGRVGKVLLKP